MNREQYLLILSVMRIMKTDGLTDVTIPQNLLEDDLKAYELQVENTADGNQTLRLRAKKHRVTVELTEEQYERATVGGWNAHLYVGLNEFDAIPPGSQLPIVEEPRA